MSPGNTSRLQTTYHITYLPPSFRITIFKTWGNKTGALTDTAEQNKNNQNLAYLSSGLRNRGKNPDPCLFRQTRKQKTNTLLTCHPSYSTSSRIQRIHGLLVPSVMVRG